MDVQTERAAALASVVLISAVILLAVLMMRSADTQAPMAGLKFRVYVDADKDPAGHVRAERESQLEMRFQQGVMMLHAQRYEHAVTAFHRVLELNPRLVEAHVNMGYSLLGLKQYKAAADFFSTAIELRPYQGNAYWGLAVALEGLGDVPGAIGAMRTYIHLAPPGEEARVRKARSAMWEWEYALKRGPLPKEEAEWLARRGREWTERNSPAADMPK
jgi:tetratricopeptide (TPR) repeat protein